MQSGKRSATTLSSFDELQTPNSQVTGFTGFDFRLGVDIGPAKSVEGPVGPHLFRMSQESTREVDLYLTMSPPVSPEETRAGPPLQRPKPVEPVEDAPRTSVPLRTWTPRQVAEWMYSIGFDRLIVDTFFINDISGVTLIDLQYEDLKELGIASFGQRHKLWTEIKALKENKLPSPTEDPCLSPAAAPSESFAMASKICSTPATPEEDVISPTSGRRRGRSHRRGDDVISPAESASIVAIEQLLPRQHKCSKGENCPKWQKQQRKLAKIATEFPLEMAQIAEAKGSPVESGLSTSIVVPSVVASSDLLGPAKPKVRLQEEALRIVQSRDPQENVRQFLQFQHLDQTQAEPSTPPYEMFPPLSPPKAQNPHSQLKTLPKLMIPGDSQAENDYDNHTAVPARKGTRTPVTALDASQRAMVHDIYRIGSPASEMDIPVTAIPLGPIERDFSSSVPPDMRYGRSDPIDRSSFRLGHRGPPPSFNMPQSVGSIKRSNSVSSHRRHAKNFAPVLVEENEPENSPTEIDDNDLTPTGSNGEEHGHSGWMKKRKTKMLRHEWHENHFRLNGSCLAMHKDEKAMEALECIDVDDYAVAISTNNSKLNSAFKRLHINGKKGPEPGAFAFQLTPAANHKGLLHAATGKTHHFAVKTQSERIDWMRELMLARARKQKDAVHASFE